MYDNMRRCPNCGSDAPCLGALRKCKESGGTYCGSCMDNGYGGSCPLCGGNESKSF